MARVFQEGNVWASDVRLTSVMAKNFTGPLVDHYIVHLCGGWLETFISNLVKDWLIKTKCMQLPIYSVAATPGTLTPSLMHD
jgi:hypothetical protein